MLDSTQETDNRPIFLRWLRNVEEECGRLVSRKLCLVALCPCWPIQPIEMRFPAKNRELSPKGPCLGTRCSQRPESEKFPEAS